MTNFSLNYTNNTEIRDTLFNQMDESIARGVKWLDETIPDWIDKIKINEFDLGKCDKCVLGFVFEKKAKEIESPSGYIFAFDMFQDGEEHKDRWGRSMTWVESHGFDRPSGGFVGNICQGMLLYQIMGMKWKEVILTRRLEMAQNK